RIVAHARPSAPSRHSMRSPGATARTRAPQSGCATTPRSPSMAVRDCSRGAAAMTGPARSPSLPRPAKPHAPPPADRAGPRPPPAGAAGGAVPTGAAAVAELAAELRAHAGGDRPLERAPRRARAAAAVAVTPAARRTREPGEHRERRSHLPGPRHVHHLHLTA